MTKLSDKQKELEREIRISPHRISCGKPFINKETGNVEINCGDDLGGSNNEFYQCSDCRSEEVDCLRAELKGLQEGAKLQKEEITEVMNKRINVIKVQDINHTCKFDSFVQDEDVCLPCFERSVYEDLIKHLEMKDASSTEDTKDGGKTK